MARFDYSRIDVVDFLEELSVQHVRDEGGEVAYSCPSGEHERGDRSPSATMEKGTTRAYCFGCGWKGNAWTFLCDFEGYGPIEALTYLKQHYGDGFLQPKNGDLVAEIDAKLQLPKLNEEGPFLNDSEADRRAIDWNLVAFSLLDDPEEVPWPYAYMMERGLTPDTLNEYEVGYDHISDRISFPVRDDQGRLVGFKGRAYDPDDMPKYLVLGSPEHGFASYDVSKILFGFHKAKHSPAFKKDGKLYVIEGEFNKMAVSQAGYENSVGISGQFISDIQVRLLANHVTHATMVFDDHEKGLQAARRVEKYVSVSLVEPHSADPMDLGRLGIKELFETAASISSWAY